MNKILALVALAVSISACGDSGRTDAQTRPDGGTSASASASAEITKKPVKNLSEKERDAVIASATKKFSVERDKMESISFYTLRAPISGKPTLEAYLSIPDGRAPIFRILARYMGDGWIFYDRIKVMADDQVVYERNFKRFEVSHDNGSGIVWEVADYPATPADIVALESIASSKSATIRFSGPDRRKDHVLSKSEVDRLRATLIAYKELVQKL